MAKTSFPYMIVWDSGSGPIDVLSKGDKWVSFWSMNDFKFYLSRTCAEAKAFIIAAKHRLVGDVTVCRYDQFVDYIIESGSMTISDERDRFLRMGREWMKKNRRPKNDRSILR